MRTWLKVIREKSGKSQYQIAAAAGLSQSYYAAIETGDRGHKLPVQTAQRIAAALDFDWQKFYQAD